MKPRAVIATVLIGSVLALSSVAAEALIPSAPSADSVAGKEAGGVDAAGGGVLADDEARVVREVLDRFDELVAAAKSLDPEAYLAFFDAVRFSGTKADGTVYHSLADFEEEYRAVVAAIESYESLEFDRVKVSVVGPATAILVNQYEAAVKIPGGEIHRGAGAGTQVWSKASGGWLLVSVSSSARPSQP